MFGRKLDFQKTLYSFDYGRFKYLIHPEKVQMNEIYPS